MEMYVSTSADWCGDRLEARFRTVRYICAGRRSSLVNLTSHQQLFLCTLLTDLSEERRDGVLAQRSFRCKTQTERVENRVHLKRSLPVNVNTVQQPCS